MSWSVAGFVAMLQRTPLMLMLDMWNSTDYAQGKGSAGHMVVVSAVVSEGRAAGQQTFLLVLDP